MGTYSKTGTIQDVTIGQSGTYTITGYGGQGGAGGDGSAGGFGAEESGTFQLTAGEKLEIVVGDVGGAGTSPYGGGGGGGGTFVLANTGTNGTFVPLLVAGGGGGAYHYAGGAGTTSSGNSSSGNAGNAGNYGGYAGGGGAGVNNSGANAATGHDGGFGGSNGSGGYSGGAGDTGAGSGGFGGGGGGGGNSGGGGGGGGFTGGNGGYFCPNGSDTSASTGGTSYDAGTPTASATQDGVNQGAGKVNLAFVSPVCYASGTLIRTTRGEIAVENLVVGDIVVTGSGGHRPIRWLGHRTFDCRAHADPTKVWPVRIAAHTFAMNKPSRDLYVSPEHSLCVDVVGGVLIAARKLVDGVGINYAPMDMVTYWHVELDGHDTLLAENMAAESYLEMGENRRFFTANDCVEVSAVALTRTHADFCLPFIAEGPILELVKLSLARRAKQLGWTIDCLASVADCLPRVA